MTRTVDQKNEATALFKVLANSKRLAILRYLRKSGFATNKVIVKNTGIPQPQVTEAMKRLLSVKLVEGEKVGTQTIYSLNQTEWKKVQHLVT